MSAAVSFENVCRYYDDVRAIDHVSFSVEEGGFFSMLGPSGSGKTTSLRLIAGFEKPTSGRILINGKATEDTPPYERSVNTVFQDYALFPHMTVLKNVSYGLMVKGVDRTTTRKKARRVLAMVKLEEMETRYPSQLSGGQRQRVALARALINEPDVLLLDEPLGALDLKLRKQMQVELKALQRQLGITFIYVTHDQDEALSMSDRLAVFNGGRIEQIGTPEEIYDRPASRFVADFVGDANVIDAEPARELTGEKRAFSIRPERIRFQGDSDDDPSALCVVGGKIVGVHYHGASTRYTVEADGGIHLHVTRPSVDARTGDDLVGRRQKIAWLRSDMCYFEA
jgi:putative spermidine/putrescine transport system ATP-binding protein